MQDRIHNRIIGGYDTRLNVLKAQIENVEAKLARSILHPPRSLSEQEALDRLQDEFDTLVAEYETRLRYARPVHVVRKIAELTEANFIDYLAHFPPNKAVGRAGLLQYCVIAIFYKRAVQMYGCKIKVQFDYALVDDGWDEAWVPLPEWTQNVVRLTTPPKLEGEYGDQILACDMRRIMSRK